MSFDFFLLSDTRFRSSYLVTKWMQAFQHVPAFRGILVREPSLPPHKRAMRENFHHTYQGRHKLTPLIKEHMYEIYPDLSETELAMIAAFGVPEHSATFVPDTLFSGFDLNSSATKDWLANVCLSENMPFFFICIDQILAPWWIELTHARVINTHPAILPYARGMYAIENVAIACNSEEFQRDAGATVHYIDTGVDTGPIITTKSLDNAFQFRSIWEHKAYACNLSFDLLIQVAQKVLLEKKPPLGKYAASHLRGPNFKSKDFTPEMQRKAEQGFLHMKFLAEEQSRSHLSEV